MNTNQKLGNKIKLLREVHNYTQEYVSSVLEVATSTYSAIERGEAQFTIERMEKLAQLYNMDLVDLIQLSDQNIIHNITNPKGSSICSENVHISNNGLSEEDRKLYTDTIRRLEEQNDRLIQLIEKLTGPQK